MKLAIQRLVRGDDGAMRIVMIDLDTLQEITDMTGYRVVSQGELVPEPVASVDTPDVPSTVQPPFVPEMSNSGGSDPFQGPADTPYAPQSQSAAQKTISAATKSGGVETTAPEDVPDDVSPPSSVEPETAGVEPSLGHLGGIRTNSGSILPDLQQARFEPVFGDATTTNKPGDTNPSFVDRSLANRNELENIKDASLGTGGQTPTAMADTRSINPSASTIAGIRGTTVAGRPEVAGSLPAAKGVANVASAPRSAVNHAISSVTAGTKPADTLSVENYVGGLESQKAQQAQEIAGVFDNRVDKTNVASGIEATSPVSRMSMMDGTKSWPSVGTRPGLTGSLPAAKHATSPNALDKTKDDYAGAPGTTQTFSVFDSPNKNIAEKVKDDVVESAKAGTTPSTASKTANSKLNRTDIGKTIQNATPAELANMGLTSRTAEEKAQIAKAVSGEMTPTAMRDLAAGKPAAQREFANIMATIENRAASTTFGSLGNTLVGDQYNSLKPENLATTNANMSKYGKTLEQAIDDYQAGVITPDDYGLSHYYSPSGMLAITKGKRNAPYWAPDMEDVNRAGLHVFGEIPGEHRPGQSFMDRRSSTVQQMDTRSQPVGSGKSAQSSPGFSVSGASRSTAGKSNFSDRSSAGMSQRDTGRDTFGSDRSPGIGRGSYSSSGSDRGGIGRNDSAGAGRGSSSGGGIGSSAGAGPGRGSSKGGPSIGGGTKSGSSGNNSGTSRGNNPGMADREKE